MICSLGDLVSLRPPVARMDVSRLIYIHATCFMRKCVTRLIYVAFLIHVTRLMYVTLLFRKSDHVCGTSLIHTDETCAIHSCVTKQICTHKHTRHRHRQTNLLGPLHGLQSVAECCRALQSVAERCSVLQYVADKHKPAGSTSWAEQRDQHHTVSFQIYRH